MGDHRAVRDGTAQGRREPGLSTLDATDAPQSPGGRRVCRVVPDVTAVDRAFDYIVPPEFGALVRVGAVVRVPLHGRRVRGWVVADDVKTDAPGKRLRPLLAAVSEGPPSDLVELSEWVAHRYAGPRVAVLRSASPPNRVAPGSVAFAPVRRRGEPPAGSANEADRTADTVAAEARSRAVAVVRWPPLFDRRRLVANLLSATGSTIVVVADGARATRLVDWLAVSGTRAVLLRGDDAAATRTAAWRTAAAGRCVVVGGRAASLAPVPDLEAVVVVDDADEALKEERAPVWHAREVLAERATRVGARVAVVSPAPSVDALAAVEAPLVVPRGFEVQGWPRVEVVDRRDDEPGAGLFSAQLAAALHATVDAGAIAVCVLNRRGRARLVACRDCGALTRRDPKGSVVWDLDPGDRCGEVPADGPGAEICPQCGSARRRVLRAGVTRVREELAALLPRVEVGEVDATTATVPEVPLLVGTESVLHRPEVRRRRPALVAYLDLDQELLAPRYRAAEQALWLLVRGAQMLAGRPRGTTRLFLQTRQPEHEVVEAVREADPERVALAEQARRRALRLPPFGGLAELSGEPPAVDAAIALLRDVDVSAAGVSVLGPSPAPGGASRALVRAPDAGVLAGVLSAVMPQARSRGRLRADVDPARA